MPEMLWAILLVSQSFSHRSLDVFRKLADYIAELEMQDAPTRHYPHWFIKIETELLKGMIETIARTSDCEIALRHFFLLKIHR